jgi:chromosome segregation ATPase
VVSFETVEHLARPDDFLASLPGILAPGGAVIISCPNDAAYGRDKDGNPFHIGQYSFEEFRTLSERHLGKASAWLLGAPLLGEINFRPGDDFSQDPHVEQAALLKRRAIENALILPAQANLTTNETQCSHYIGIWGADAAPNAVVSSLPVAEYQGPWQAAERLRSQVEELERLKTERFEPELEQLGQANAELKAAQAAMAAERDELCAAKADLERRLEEGQVLLDGVSAERAALQARIANEFEMQIARLEEEAAACRLDMAGLTKDIGRLRSENAGLAAERNALSTAKAELQERLAQERVSLEQVIAERAVLSTRIEENLEPQVARLTGEISALRREVSRLKKSNDRLQGDNRGTTALRKAHSALKTELETATATLADLERKRAEWYEPELARLKSHVEHSKFEKETQILRRRVMAYADQSRRMAGSISVLEAKIAEQEKLRDTWYVPELARLSGVIEEYEKTKKEWFEPQLDSRAAHIAELQAMIARLENEKRTRLEPQLQSSTARVAKLEAQVRAMEDPVHNGAAKTSEKRLSRMLRLNLWSIF